MPVSAKVDGFDRNNYYMAEPGRYITMAPWAKVFLGGLIGLDKANL